MKTLPAILAAALVLLTAGCTEQMKKDYPDARAPLRVSSTAVVRTAGDVTIGLGVGAIQDPAVSTNQFEQPAAGHHFVAYTLLIENAGTKETHGGTFTLRTADGFEYRQKFLSGIGAGDTGTFQSLTSGGKVQTTIGFEVPDGARVQWLKFDPNPFAPGDLYFDGDGGAVVAAP